MSDGSTLKAVIFDMDGVLIDSEPLHFEVDTTVLKSLNLELEPNYLEQFVGFTTPAMWTAIKSQFSIERSLEELISLQSKTKLAYLKKSAYGPIEGILDILEELEIYKIPIGIASSSPRIFIEAVIDKIGVSDYFSVWVSGEEVEKSKPEPDVFFKCAQVLGIEPENCLVIEDSRNGTIAAKKAGMKCIGFQNVNSGNQDLSMADLIVPNMREVNLGRMKSLFI